MSGGYASGKKLTDAQRLAWLRLYRSENVGPQTFLSLINHFGGAGPALEALPELARRGGAARSPRICPAVEAEKELATLERMGARLIARGEPDFPPLLALTEGSPPLLAVRGEVSALLRPCIAIVGGRNASSAGRAFAQRLASALAARDYVVVSGLARGIDTAAHEGALAGGTIAALGGGLERIYPPENHDLSERIAASRGALVSEMPPGHQARGKDFPRRNRIIAGLSLGTVVVEAALRSGSLITARLAGEMGRDVMAAPGSPLDPRCEGSNRLIRNGATLITSADEVIEALGPLGRAPELPFPSLGERDGLEQDDPPATECDEDIRVRVAGLLGPSPCGVDDIIRHANAPARHVQIALMELELAGRIERHANGSVSVRSLH